jgi:hypothetical protein
MLHLRLRDAAVIIHALIGIALTSPVSLTYARAWADAPWPPVVIGDPHPVSIVVPAFWPEPDKDVARLWVALQQETRGCLLIDGVDYRYAAPWAEYDRNGRPLVRPSPPDDWTAAFAGPVSGPAAVGPCFDQALATVGCPVGSRDPALGPTSTTCARVGKEFGR